MKRRPGERGKTLAPKSLSQSHFSPATSKRNDNKGGNGGPASWCARVVMTAEQLLLCRLGAAPEGGTKPCHSVGGPARQARKWRRAPSGLDLIGGRGDAKPTLPVFGKGRWKGAPGQRAHGEPDATARSFFFFCFGRRFIARAGTECAARSPRKD
uniref:Uncharacterized protein n=1 Tax=Oryza sativa subsp. japonica TaxID=39947 RepID=Q6H846_ORYSJ|nr:hypothetical protein [Oryza sativa Japonica Group]